MRDVEIRSALVDEIRREHPDAADNRVWSEFSVVLGASRVDVCLVNGSLTGWEIKSPRDNFDRLASQIAHYGQVLDFAHIVVASKDLDRAKAKVPTWWGITEAAEVDGVVHLRQRRRSRRNRHVDPLSVAQLLWREEALAVVRALEPDGRWSKATRWELWDVLVEAMPLDKLRDTVRQCLKLRPARLADRRYASDDGKSLLPAT